MKTLSLVPLLLAIACATTQTTPDASVARTIALELLDRGARSWNRGDLDAFHGGVRLVARGPTSLVLVRDDARWGILKDHSS